MVYKKREWYKLLKSQFDIYQGKQEKKRNTLSNLFNFQFSFPVEHCS